MQPEEGVEPSNGMSQQPELTSPVLPESLAVTPAPAAGHPHHPHRIPPWLQRMELFVRVLLRLYFGLACCIAPWWPLFWDRNPLFTQFPALGQFAAYGAVRGIITGLGLLNLWIAFRRATEYREE
jgi:hypothetical protein